MFGIWNKGYSISSHTAPQHALQCRSCSPGKWCQTGAQRTPWIPETTSVCSRSNAGGADNVIPSPDNVSNKNEIDPLLSQGGPGPRVSGNEIHIYNRGKGFVRKHLSPQWSRCLSNIKLHMWNMSNVFNCVVDQKNNQLPACGQTKSNGWDIDGPQLVSSWYSKDPSEAIGTYHCTACTHPGAYSIHVEAGSLNWKESPKRWNWNISSGSWIFITNSELYVYIYIQISSRCWIHITKSHIYIIIYILWIMYCYGIPPFKFIHSLNHPNIPEALGQASRRARDLKCQSLQRKNPVLHLQWWKVYLYKVMDI